MVYAFKRVTISGLDLGKEGTSAALTAMTEFLTNDVGWIMVDDRRTQGGNPSLASTHKVVLRNGGGESANSPEWYVTLASGVAAAVNNNNIDAYIHTAYDVASHAVPASGVVTPAVRGGVTYTCDSDGYFNIYMVGDKDGAIFFNNQSNTSQHLIFGKVYPLLNGNYEPYGLYLASGASVGLSDTSVRGIIGEPPVAITAGSEGSFIYYNPSATQDPRLGYPNFIQPSFFLGPFMYVSSNASNKGAIGIVRHAWSMQAQAIGLPEGTVISGTSGRTYLAFTDSSISTAIRIV